MSDGNTRPITAYLPWMARVARRMAPWVPRSLRLRLRPWLFAFRPYKMTLPSGLSARVTSYADWGVYCEVFIEGQYDLALARAMDAAAAPQQLRFADIGANIGMFTLRVVDRLRERWGNGVAPSGTLIEANATVLGELRRRVVDENGIERLRLVHGLAGKKEGAAVLHTARLHSVASIMGPSERPGTAVSFVDLDALFANDDVLDLMKIDIEGAELLLLETYPALLKRVRVIALELHPYACNSDRCKALLDAAGFVHNHELPMTNGGAIYTAWR